jgi:hypothetical protein
MLLSELLEGRKESNKRRVPRLAVAGVGTHVASGPRRLRSNHRRPRLHRPAALLPHGRARQDFRPAPTLPIRPSKKSIFCSSRPLLFGVFRLQPASSFPYSRHCFPLSSCNSVSHSQSSNTGTLTPSRNCTNADCLLKRNPRGTRVHPDPFPSTFRVLPPSPTQPPNPANASHSERAGNDQDWVP